jgi:hypothetical protein
VLPFEPNGAGGAFGVLDLAITPSGLLAGGDFLTMGGTPRPRFARFGIGADAHGPTRPAAPRVVERTPGTLSVSWDGARDTTDLNITYRVLRDGAETPVFTTLGPGVPALRYSFVDTSVAVGEQHRYRVVVDDGGFTATGPDSAPVTVTGATTPYRTQVLGDGPGSYWQLGDPEGSATAADASGRGVHGVVLSGATFGAEGVPRLGPDTALQLSGSAPAVASPSSSVGSNRYSVEAWVKTSDSGGGKFFGFGSSQSEPSEMFDRHVWLGSDGRLSFGNRQSNAIRVVGGSRSPVVNDGRWHHVVATLGYSGMHLYVDGVQVDARTDTKRGQNYEGFWRLGGDKLDGWPGTSGLDRYPSGRLDEVAIYGYELPADAVAGHYRAAVGCPRRAARSADVDADLVDAALEGVAPGRLGPDGDLGVVGDAAEPHVVAGAGAVDGDGHLVVGLGAGELVPGAVAETAALDHRLARAVLVPEVAAGPGATVAGEELELVVAAVVTADALAHDVPRLRWRQGGEVHPPPEGDVRRPRVEIGGGRDPHDRIGPVEAVARALVPRLAQGHVPARAVVVANAVRGGDAGRLVEEPRSVATPGLTGGQEDTQCGQGHEEESSHGRNLRRTAT